MNEVIKKLTPYLHHKTDCNFYHPSLTEMDACIVPPCDCGYDEALAILEQQPDENKHLKEYAQHKPDCEAFKSYHDPTCPDCKSRNTGWRYGVGFEGEKSCMDCPATFTPIYVRGECSCGFEVKGGRKWQ